MVLKLTQSFVYIPCSVLTAPVFPSRVRRAWPGPRVSEGYRETWQVSGLRSCSETMVMSMFDDITDPPLLYLFSRGSPGSSGPPVQPDSEETRLVSAVAKVTETVRFMLSVSLKRRREVVGANPLLAANNDLNSSQRFSDSDFIFCFCCDSC